MMAEPSGLRYKAEPCNESRIEFTNVVSRRLEFDFCDL